MGCIVTKSSTSNNPFKLETVDNRQVAKVVPLPVVAERFELLDTNILHFLLVSKTRFK
jgi:hypothetical protein